MLKYTVKKYCSDGSKVNQIIMASLMVLPVFSYGTGVGWLSPMGPLLMSANTPAEEPVNPVVISWMASIVYLVGTPAVFLFGYIVDNFGRKKALLLVSLSMAVSWSLKLYSTKPWALIAARGIMGLGVSGNYVVTPLYIKEISEDSIRGTLGTLIILSQNLGNLLVYLMGEYLSYRSVLWICLAVPLVHLLAFMIMPETPSYLLKVGKVEEARDALAWLRCRQPADAMVDDEMQGLINEMEKKNAGSFFHAFRSLVSDNATCKAFRITLTITLARELCGCLAVLHFASTIFGEASNHDFALSANQQAAVLGAVQMLGSITASGLVEKAGRKPLLGTTCLVSGISLIALGLWFFLKHVSIVGSSTAWVPVSALCLCIFCDAAGLQPVPFVIMTEIFPFQLRATVTSIVIAFACALVSLELRFFHPIAESLGIFAVFWMFASVCVISTVYIFLYVPETKQRSLEDIYDEISGKKQKDCETNQITRL